MSNEFKFWLGTLVAYILVVIYAGAVFIMLFYPGLVGPEAASNTTSAASSTVSSLPSSEKLPVSGITGIEDISILVGGLISALIISILATTQPQEGTIARLTNTKSKDQTKTIVRIKSIVMYMYIGVWLITGATALVLGTMLHVSDGPFVTTVSNIGTAWLATAVASGYAYFGLNPPPSPDQ